MKSTAGYTPTWIAASVSWWRRWSIGRCAFAVTCLAGVLLIVIGETQNGAWLIALTGGLIVLSWTGVFRTSYQRQVARAISPIYRSTMRRFEDSLNLDAELILVERLAPPADLLATHEGIVRAMREVIDVRWQMSSRDLARHWKTAIVRQERLNAWRNLDKYVNHDDERISHYVTELRGPMTEFEAKQHMIAERRHKEAEGAIARLLEIVPSKSHASAHRTLIDSLVCALELTKRQREFLHNYDEGGMTRTARELIKNEARMRRAIRRIRWWY